MLSSISWLHYLAALVTLTVSYYIYLALRYYQSEVSNLFGIKKKNNEMFGGVPSSTFGVMGKAKPEDSVSTSDSQQLEFAESLPDEAGASPTLAANAVKSPDLSTSPSQDLISEAGNLIDVFRDIDNKQEFITLLGILINSYKRFKDEIDFPGAIERIVKLSKKKLKFPVAISDLQSTWQ